MNHDTLYRVPAAALQDLAIDDAAIKANVEAVGKKSLNDGSTTDQGGNVFLTDIEHAAIVEIAPDGKLSTVVKDKRIRRADGLSFDPDGWLYLADSAIPLIVLQSAAHHAEQAPYYVWRLKPGTSAPAGQWFLRAVRQEQSAGITDAQHRRRAHLLREFYFLAELQ